MWAQTEEKLEELKAKARERFGKISARADKRTVKMLEDLQHRDPARRQAAAEALGEIGEAAKSAIPHLQALWEDKSLYFTIRHAAGRSLDKLGSAVDWSAEG